MSQITLQDVMCPICLSILIEPVTMPCSHSLCMPCFSQHVKETSLACPLCRKRISVWVRCNSKSNRLVNTKLWNAIKKKFSAKVEARLQGVEESDEDEFVSFEPRVCAPGEIRQEYEALVEQELEELATKRSREEELSSKLILQLQEEEKMRLRNRRELEERLCKEDEDLAQQIKESEDEVLQEQLKHLQMLCGSDEEVARQIEKEEKMKSKLSYKVSVTPAKGPMDVFIGQKTPRSHGKLLVPDVPNRSCSKTSDFSSRSCQYSDNLSSSKTSSGNRSSPTASTSVSCYLVSDKDGGRKYHMDSKLGRQLREIASSQSSESESDELTDFANTNKFCRTISSGKENVSKSENIDPRKPANGSKIASPHRMRNKSKDNSPHKKKRKSLVYKARSFSPEIGVFVDRGKQDVIEDSDETDINDDDSDYETLSNTYTNRNKTKNIVVSRNNQAEKSCLENVKEIKGKVGLEDEEEDNNSSMDYGLLFTDEELYVQNLEKLRREQLRVEEQLRQEELDRLLAQELQKQMDQESRVVNRSRGTEDEYALRNRRPTPSTSKNPLGSQKSTSAKRERQTTLTEALGKRRKLS